MDQFDEIGAALFPGAALAVLGALDACFADLPLDRAGVRLHDIAGLSPLLGGDGPLGAIAAARLGDTTKPVRAILFDKSPSANWSLGWHQDRTIAVRERIDVPGFGPWTRKQNMLHVEPPFAVIEAMLTMRVHLDAVPSDNGPLLIAPGSHRLGRIAEDRYGEVIAQCGHRTCLADAGDIWLYSTPILHASDASRRPVRRRVLHVDFSAGALPVGLAWLGV